MPESAPPSYEGNKAGMFALLFPLVGSGLLVWAVRSTIRFQKYGSSRFELATLPGVIGHTISGSVRIPTLLEPGDGILRHPDLCAKGDYPGEERLDHRDHSLGGRPGDPG